MNEHHPPLGSSSDQDSFPSPPPGFLRQEEKGEKQILSLYRAQRGTEQRSPARASPPHPRAGMWLQQKLGAAVVEGKYICKSFTSIEEKHRIQVRKGTQMRFAVEQCLSKEKDELRSL